MNNKEAVNWLINISEDIGKAEHSDLWHYEQALTEIKDMLESAQPEKRTEKRTETHACELISRQAAIDAVSKYNFDYPQYMERFVTELRDAMKADLKHDIEELPPAQPERPKGEWIDLDSDTEEYDDIMCSNCKQSFMVDAYRWCDIGFTVDDLKFCPNCGANMRG